MNIPAYDVKEIREMSGKYLVRYRKNKGNCCCFVSKTQFIQDFVAFRRDRHMHDPVEVKAISLFSGMFAVKFQSSNDWHRVEIDPLRNKYSCGCEDFKRQNPESKFRVCSHLVPVAKHLGFGSFSELMKTRRAMNSFITLGADD